MRWCPGVDRRCVTTSPSHDVVGVPVDEVSGSAAPFGRIFQMSGDLASLLLGDHYL